MRAFIAAVAAGAMLASGLVASAPPAHANCITEYLFSDRHAYEICVAQEAAAQQQYRDCVSEHQGTFDDPKAACGSPP